MSTLNTYRSTKTVQAMLIESIAINPDYTATITDASGNTVEVTSEYVLREKPKAGGYYMLNGEGFDSFIDKDLFETDFSLI
ncbi:hypothetical protein NJHLHPIG_00062 [Klebsiella phage vB_KqM-Bilbo]|jgi:hypothetical protein|nr:hypothetical protein NJHLHPIG_00062 [Klebsiella phage vB_KqM-Bilbo]CAD5240574.1 hypothetical protein KBDEFBCI_00059 [Klebsiella phage vB_KqM-LilBean]DAK05646.1 MAG TPA: Dec protein, OB-Fold, Decoration, VIRAL PROTEIN [Caudoviricetes sp.]